LGKPNPFSHETLVFEVEPKYWGGKGGHVRKGGVLIPRSHRKFGEW